MDKLLLSMIIPCYNTERYVLRAVDSVLTQPAGGGIELLTVDDGSWDKSAELLDYKCTTDSRVIVIHQKNQGVSMARNHAIDAAKSKYVGFLDADDFWNKDFLDLSICKIINMGEYDIIGFSYNRITFDGRYQRNYSVRIDKGSESDERDELDDYHFCSFVYRRKFLLVHRLYFPKVKNNEDSVFLSMVSSFVPKYRKIDKNIFNYVMNPESNVHRTDSISMFSEQYNAWSFFNEFCKQNGIDYWFTFDIFILANRLIPAFCAYHKYKESCSFCLEDPRLKVIKHYKEFPLEGLPAIKKTIASFVEHPFLYWIKCRTIVRAIFNLKYFLYKHPGLRKPFDDVFYTRAGWKRVTDEWILSMMKEN